MDGFQRSLRRWTVVAILTAILAPPDSSCLAQGPAAPPAAPVSAKPRAAADLPRLPAKDQAIVRANDEGAYPSSQQSQPMMPQTQPMMPQTQPSYIPAPVAPQMMVNQTMQMPMQAFVNQAAPAMTPSVVNVPTLVYMPQATAMAAPAMATASAVPSFFLPATSAAMAQPAASFAMPAQTMAMPMMSQAMVAAMPMMSQGLVAAASQPMAQPFATAGSQTALTNQSVSLPTSRSSTKVRVRGPGLVGSGLARFGERLTQLGKTRIETVQETEMQASFTQPSGGVATIQTTAATPVLAPQSATFTPQAQPQAQPQPVCPAPPPQAPMASPQAGPAKPPHFWHH